MSAQQQPAGLLPAPVLACSPRATRSSCMTVGSNGDPSTTWSSRNVSTSGSIWILNLRPHHGRGGIGPPSVNKSFYNEDYQRERYLSNIDVST